MQDARGGQRHKGGGSQRASSLSPAQGPVSTQEPGAAVRPSRFTSRFRSPRRQLAVPEPCRWVNEILGSCAQPVPVYYFRALGSHGTPPAVIAECPQGQKRTAGEC